MSGETIRFKSLSLGCPVMLINFVQQQQGIIHDMSLPGRICIKRFCLHRRLKALFASSVHQITTSPK